MSSIGEKSQVDIKRGIIYVFDGAASHPQREASKPTCHVSVHLCTTLSLQIKSVLLLDLVHDDKRIVICHLIKTKKTLIQKKKSKYSPNYFLLRTVKYMNVRIPN